MIVTRIEAENFRSFRKIEGSFSKNLNIILGPNGSGKTNLLELLFFSLYAKGFRSSNDSDLLYSQPPLETPFLRSESKYLKDGIHKTIKIVYQSDGVKDINFNGRINEKINNLFFESNIVIFSPGSSQLIKGGPSIRKNFIDRLSMKLKKEYSIILSKYTQTLRNRNALIKRRWREQGDENLYEILTQNIIDFSNIIQEERKKMVDIFNESIQLSIQSIDVPGLSELKLQYSPYILSSRNISQLKIEENKKGVTTIGSHLDQLLVKKGIYEAKNYLSEGEQKIAAFLLKLCEFQLVEKNTKNIPIFLLDDLYSELDDQNAKKVIDYLNGKSQIFLTCLHTPEIQGDQIIELERNQEEVWIQ